MATRADFWGEIQADEVRTPVTILREQAALLGPKTQNIVEAKVDTITFGTDVFRHSFRLVVPALDGYTYELFSIKHGIMLYPVDVVNDGTTYRDEHEFTLWLQSTLSSPATKRIIANLVGQARDSGKPPF